jgi:uncharacterized membrane protein YkvA (DUF1232 family)
VERWVVVLVVALALLTIATLAVTIFLLVKLVTSFRQLRSAQTPVAGRTAFWAALAYTICPVDLLPDPVYLDDIGVLLAALRVLDKAAAQASARRSTTARDG